MPKSPTRPTEEASDGNLPKAYDPSLIERRWAEYWVSERLFDVPTPELSSDGSNPFALLLPPPAAVAGNRTRQTFHRRQQVKGYVGRLVIRRSGMSNIMHQ